jgi:hypothetical protein
MGSRKIERIASDDDVFEMFAAEWRARKVIGVEVDETPFSRIGEIGD